MPSAARSSPRIPAPEVLDVALPTAERPDGSDTMTSARTHADSLQESTHPDGPLWTARV